MKTFALLTTLALAAGLAGCARWQHDVTLRGATFSEVRVDDRGFTIGLIATDTMIGDRNCKRGWVHVHPNGVVAAFTTVEPITFGATLIPADTWVRQDEAGTIRVCAFPAATLVQGQWCRGTGGPKGVQTAFHPNGALKQFYPVREVTIDGFKLRTNSLNGWIELHENGRLKSGVLDEDLQRDGRKIRRGSRIELAPDGQLAPPAEPPLEILAYGG